MRRRRTTTAAALLVAALVGCTGGSTGSGGTPRESDGIFDPLPDRSLPPIATADCPAAEDLLTTQQAEDAPGDRLPDLTLDCIGSDRAVALRAVGGVPTVLNVWASWCLPCRKEMPAFQRVHAAAGGSVRFLGVNVADSGEAAARSTIQQTGVAYANVRSPGRAMLNGLRVPGPPVTLFVDARGTLVHREVGELTDDELRARIAEHLGVDVPAGP